MNKFDIEYLALNACKHRVLYRLQARNIKIGIYDSDMQGFHGIRTKWGARFIDSENHWDCKEFATAKPIKELERLPDEISLDNKEQLFAWLDQKLTEIK